MVRIGARFRAMDDDDLQKKISSPFFSPQTSYRAVRKASARIRVLAGTL